MSHESDKLGLKAEVWTWRMDGMKKHWVSETGKTDSATYNP